ncbi:MAG TPA: type II toxin-antitoxin system PemK/MazF family toxin [Puia sp.]|nr:type II toxin-antitoxin system PemK/MazF family toxin [Puia sp.]
MNQFDVYIVDLDPALGSEMRKIRPAVIISPNAMNKNLDTVIIAPLTHTIKGYPSRVLSNFAGSPGAVALDQMRTVDKSRLKQKQGRVDGSTAANIKAILTAMFS